MHKEVIEKTLEEFTKVTGDVEKLINQLHMCAQLPKSTSPTRLFPDPVKELNNLRNKIEEKSGKS
jgi:hypothetical protein